MLGLEMTSTDHVTESCDGQEVSDAPAGLRSGESPGEEDFLSWIM